MAYEVNIGYEVLVSCHDKLVSEIASDPKQMAGLLFQHRFISEDTKDKVNQLDRTKKDMARILVDDLQAKVKSYPEYYEKFLMILTENSPLYEDLLSVLQEVYKALEGTYSRGTGVHVSDCV